MKKLIAILAASLTLLSALTACGGDGGDGSDNENAVPGNNSFGMSDAGDDDEDDDDDDDDDDDEEENSENYSTEFEGVHRIVAYGNKDKISADEMLSYVEIDIDDDNSYVLYKVNGKKKEELLTGSVRSHDDDVMNLDVDIPDEEELTYLPYYMDELIGRSDYRLYDDGCMYISNLDFIRRNVERAKIELAIYIQHAYDASLTDLDAKGYRFVDGLVVIASNGYGYNDKVILSNKQEGVLSEELKRGVENYFEDIYDYEYIAIIYNCACLYVAVSDSWESCDISTYPSSDPADGSPYFTGESLKDILKQIKAADKNYHY